MRFAKPLKFLIPKHSDDLATDPLTKRLFVSTLIKLSRLSGLYPQSLVRNDIQISGVDPVARGAHGEVWMGTKEDGGRVAVKVLRIFSSADTTKLLKVSLRSWCSPRAHPYSHTEIFL